MDFFSDEEIPSKVKHSTASEGTEDPTSSQPASDHQKVQKTDSTTTRRLHHRSHSKLESEFVSCASQAPRPPTNTTPSSGGGGGGGGRRRSSSSRHGHRRSESTFLTGVKRPSEQFVPPEPGSPSIAATSSSSSAQLQMGPGIVVTTTATDSIANNNKEHKMPTPPPLSPGVSPLMLDGCCRCSCVCPEVLVFCKKCKLPYSKVPTINGSVGVMPSPPPPPPPSSSSSPSSLSPTSSSPSPAGVTPPGCCCNGNIKMEVFADNCKTRLANMYEKLGRISSVVYEIMQNFDFTNPVNQPPVGVDTNAYLKRLTTNYMFAIKNVQAIAVGALVEAMKQEDENLKAESLHMLTIRKTAEKRERHFQELIDTEKNFNDGLRLLLDVWKPAMESAGLLDKYADDVFFKTVPLVKKTSDSFLECFEAVKRLPPRRQNLGKVLCDNFGRLGAFKQNCLTQQDASALIKKLSGKQSFKTLETRIKEDPQIKNLNFAEYIFSPAQRITRYPLLIKDIIKATDQRHPDYNYLVEFYNKLGELNKDINDTNALQSSVDQFVALKLKLKWTHEPYDFIANKALIHFSGKASWKMFEEDPKKPASKGNYVVFTNKCVLACTEKIRDLRELEIMPIKEWAVVGGGDTTSGKSSSNNNNNFVLTPLDKSKGPHTFVIECSDYVSMMNYKRTYETCMSSTDLSPTPSKLPLAKILSPTENEPVHKAQPTVTEYTLSPTDISAGDGAAHPKRSRSIRNPPKINPSEVFLIDSRVNGFFGPPSLKEDDINDDLHSICSGFTQPTGLRVLAASPLLDLPDSKRASNSRINTTKHRHKLSLTLSGQELEAQSPEPSSTVKNSPRKSVNIPRSTSNKKFSPSPAGEPSSNNNNNNNNSNSNSNSSSSGSNNEKSVKTPRTPKGGMFKKLSHQALDGNGDLSD